jgi:hypothetical protein
VEGVIDPSESESESELLLALLSNSMTGTGSLAAIFSSLTKTLLVAEERNGPFLSSKSSSEDESNSMISMGLVIFFSSLIKAVLVMEARNGPVWLLDLSRG